MKRSRFDYVSYDKQSVEDQTAIKANCQELEHCVNNLLPDSRWKRLFMTHLEIAYMAVGKAIRDEQIKRDSSTTLEEGRSDS
jgi:hypothetical protein